MSLLYLLLIPIVSIGLVLLISSNYKCKNILIETNRWNRLHY